VLNTLDAASNFWYSNAVILSDRDLTNGWPVRGHAAADGTLEARLFYLQNWRNDLCAVADGGIIARHYRYSAYGTRTEIDNADYNRDDVTDFADYLDFVSDFSGNQPRSDVNRDGGQITSASFQNDLEPAFVNVAMSHQSNNPPSS
jgi:hypothetical protein